MISVREKASRERNYIQSRAKTTTNEPATVRASLTPIGNDSEGASMSEAADEPQVFNRNTQIEGIQACDPCDPAHGTEEQYDAAGVRKGGVKGKSVSVRVDLGGRRRHQKKTHHKRV